MILSWECPEKLHLAQVQRAIWKINVGLNFQHLTAASPRPQNEISFPLCIWLFGMRAAALFGGGLMHAFSLIVFS